VDEVTLPETPEVTRRVVLRPGVAVALGVVVGVGVGIAIAAALTKVARDYGDLSPSSVVVEDDSEPEVIVVSARVPDDVSELT
jgi:hypothetical protein